MAEAGALQGDSAAVDTGAVSKVVNDGIPEYTGGGPGSIDITANSGITVDAINDLFANGYLDGQGQAIVNAANKWGIDPGALAAVVAQETGQGTSNVARKNNNFGGLIVDDEFLHFNTIEEGLDEVARWLHNYVVEDGEKHLGRIKLSWAPDGADNDPDGLNQNWLPNIGSFYRQMGGTY